MGLLDSLHRLLGNDINTLKGVGRQINPFDSGASYNNPNPGNAYKGTPATLPWAPTPGLPQGRLPLTAQAPAIPNLNQLLNTANIGINNSNFSGTHIGIPSPMLPNHTFYYQGHVNPIPNPIRPTLNYLPRIGG